MATLTIGRGEKRDAVPMGKEGLPPSKVRAESLVKMNGRVAMVGVLPRMK